jgi:Sec-independent protein translocase protein TatA
MTAVSLISPLAFIGTPSPSEMLFLAVIALLVFGKDLPNVVRQWGKTFGEFRRHLNGMRSELNEVIYAEPERPKLQYHPEFQNRNPLPEPIPAEGAGDLSEGVNGNGNGHADASTSDRPATPLPTD